MKHLVGLLIGLAVGIVGTILYTGSLPPEEGSLEKKVETQAQALRQAEHRIAELENTTKTLGIEVPGDSFRDRTRKIAENVRNGEFVDINDVFGAFKPVMRDLSPLCERMRVASEKESYDSLIGHYSREYDLTPQQERELRNSLEKAAMERAERVTRLVEDESSTFRDFLILNREMEEDFAENYMGNVLTGAAREQYLRDRLAHKAELAQAEADRNLSRLSSLVELDEDQKDQVFVLMARSSRHFDPSMQFGGVDSTNTPLAPGSSREEAIRSVLRPEQQVKFNAAVALARREADEELNRM